MDNVTDAPNIRPEIKGTVSNTVAPNATSGLKKRGMVPKGPPKSPDKKKGRLSLILQGLRGARG